jgi:hypothetical protein
MTTYATPSQKQYIHGLYRACGWDDEQYRWMLMNDYGVESSSELTISQAHELIGLLQMVVKGENMDKATMKQITLIRCEWKEVDYSNGENGDVHLNAFIQKKFKKRAVENLSRLEAIKLINMIKFLKKQAKEREGKTVVINKLAACVYCGSPIMWVQLKDGKRVAFNCIKKPGRDYEAVSFHECKNRK